MNRRYIIVDGVLDVNASFIKSDNKRYSYLGNDSKLTSLDELPLDIRVLKCTFTELNVLPLLPEGLEDLYVKHNELSSLGKLPKTLRELTCNNNKIEYLPELPNGLKLLRCHHNKLTSLPELPDSLMILDCTYNNLKYLPKIPNEFVGISRRLYCHNNPLECLIPSRFILQQDDKWLYQYYLPYIKSYNGQKNILSREPWMIKELMEQTSLRNDIFKEFGYLINVSELNLI